jgi:hypothetical protein
MRQKWPHFRELAPTTSVQLNNPLSANYRKFPIRKPYSSKALQKSKKLVTFSMTGAASWACRGD